MDSPHAAPCPTGTRTWYLASGDIRASPRLVIFILCLLTPTSHSSSNTISSLLSSKAEVMRWSNHTQMADYSRVVEYETLIYRCLAKVTSNTERCVETFNRSYVQHQEWIGAYGAEQPDEKVRRYCCMQSEFKDCWTASIRRSCSELEARLSKWLPLQVLKDLRTDERCHNYVLYPHKCRENSFSLWQILAFLLLVPFVAFWAIIFTIALCKPHIAAYKSLKMLRTNQEIAV